MQFQVPQFIEVEDKIFGPFTFRQFVYIAGGAGLSFFIFKVLPLPIAIFFIAPIIGLSFALAFYKIYNKPFIEVIESAFRYSTRNKLYLWKKKEKEPKAKEEEKEPVEVYVPRLSESKLKDLTWALDVHESLYASQEGPDRPKQDKESGRKNLADALGS